MYSQFMMYGQKNIKFVDLLLRYEGKAFYIRIVRTT